MTIEALAAELNIPVEDVRVLAGQINDDADLYDTETDLLTEAGAALIRQHITEASAS